VTELRLATELLARIRERESRYDELAYLFVLESIEFLQHRLPVRRHVSGSELARACRDHAVEQYGLMAQLVLEHWGIRGTGDIGRIVYTLVGVGLLVTQTEDREEDFHAVYDFDDAFSASYPWAGLRPARRGARASDVRGEGP
jgi:uncharacterized repeat protein (TIGR04138 family)